MGKQLGQLLLTAKQKKIIDIMFGGEKVESIYEAVKIAYGTKGAKQYAYFLKNCEPFRERFAKLTKQAGIDPLFPFLKIIQKMNAKTLRYDKVEGKYIEMDDNLVQLNACRMFYELLGGFAKEVQFLPGAGERPGISAGDIAPLDQLEQNKIKAQAIQAKFTVIDPGENAGNSAENKRRSG